MNQAVSGVTPCIRSTSRALIPFFAADICTMTMSHVRRLTLVPWKIVPVSTLNCLRHLAHFQTRRTLWVRLPSAFSIPVPRAVPFFGVRK